MRKINSKQSSDQLAESETVKFTLLCLCVVLSYWPSSDTSPMLSCVI